MSDKFIYVSGDSFLAGEELADDTLMCWQQQWGTYLRRSDISKASPAEKKHALHKFYSKFLNVMMAEIQGFSEQRLQQYKQIKLERTFWNILCKKNNWGYHVDALGASSQEATLHRALLSFIDLEKQNKKIDLAIIGLSPYSRVTFFVNQNQSEYKNRKDNVYFSASIANNIGYAKSLQYGFVFQPNHQNDEAVAVESLLKIEHEKGNAIRYLNTLILTKVFFKEKTGKYPIFIDPGHCMEILYKFIDDTYYNDMLKEFLKDTVILRMSVTDYICPGGHHAPSCHEKTAIDFESTILTHL
jgi:hypothetical protein